MQSLNDPLKTLCLKAQLASALQNVRARNHIFCIKADDEFTFCCSLDIAATCMPCLAPKATHDLEQPITIEEFCQVVKSVTSRLWNLMGTPGHITRPSKTT